MKMGLWKVDDRILEGEKREREREREIMWTEQLWFDKREGG